MNAEAEKLVVNLFSEVRIEKNDPNYPGGIKIEYDYKFEGFYTPEDEMEVLVVEGMAKMTTFHFSEEIHPATGKPFYIVVLNKGKLSGNVIKLFEGAGSGFYLVQGLEVDDRGYLIKGSGSGENKMSPLTSKPIAGFFQKIISKVDSKK